MKALTICQPYAELIARGDKRIENRTWPTMYRGPLLIHAGKSRQWLTDDGPDLDPRENYGVPLAAMQFGAVIATSRLVNCVKVEAIHSGKYDDIYPWARDHEHANGPWCWVLDDVRRLPAPVPYRGAQGLFDIDWPLSSASPSAGMQSPSVRHGHTVHNTEGVGQRPIIG